MVPLTATLITLLVGAALLPNFGAAPSQAAQKAGGKAKPSRTKKIVKRQPLGGANQVEGLNGKIGQMLFTGKWRFQVLDVQQVNSYTLKMPSSEQDYAKYHDVAEYDLTTHTFTPKSGYTLVAINCLAKNAQNKVQQLDFYLNDPKTALADDKGNSYPPIAYDMQSKGAWMTKPLLPGSGESLTVLFATPPGTNLKDLVITLKNWADHAGRDVRVSLAR